MNVDALNPYVDNMLQERKKAVDKINAMFGTEISVELGSSWAIRKKENKTETETETETETDKETDEEKDEENENN